VVRIDPDRVAAYRVAVQDLERRRADPVDCAVLDIGVLDRPPGRSGHGALFARAVPGPSRPGTVTVHSIRGELRVHRTADLALYLAATRGGETAAVDAVAAIAVRCAIGGDAATAALLFGGAEPVRGSRRTALFGGYWAAQQAAVRAVLGDAAFDAAYAEGAAAGFDNVVATALAVEHPDLEYGSVRFAPTLG